MAETDLKNKVVVITGATCGIGEGSALEFAKQGSKLVICGRNLEGLQDTKNQCVQLGLKDEDVVIVIGDITQDDILDNIVKATLDAFGRVDVLFLNAARMHAEGGTVLSPDSVKALDFFYDIFIKSPYKLTQKFSEELIKTKGSIVINASIYAEMVPIQVTQYSIFKAAQMQMMKLFALTFASKGVRVNAVRPGWVKTNILAVEDWSKEEIAEKEKCYEYYGSLTALGGSLTTVEEISRLVVFLASKQAACMTGTSVTGDKGFLLLHPAVDWTQL